MTTLQMKRENDNLKKQLYASQKQIDEYKKQLDELQSQTQRRKSSDSKKQIPSKQIPSLPLKKHITNSNNDKIVTSVNKNDATNALLAKFSAKKPSSTNNGIIATVNKNDATNALLSKFAKQKSENVLNSSPTELDNKTLFKKYEIMLKIGVDLSGVITQMKKDDMEQNVINEFNKLHGGTNTDDEKEETDPIKLGLPSKADIAAPKQAMKRLHWTPVKIKRIKQSIWGKVNQTWHDYDPLSFELNFQTRTQKPCFSKDALKQAVDKQSENNEIWFVSSQRSQQVQIGLRKYHMTNEQLRCMILTVDDTKLNVDDLSALIDIIPTPEEQVLAEKMSEEKEINNFGIAERFFYSLYDIIELQPRFKKWLFMLQFDEKIHRLNEWITIIEKAKTVIVHSKNLKQIFSVLLAFGNHMNYGNKAKGNCYGFHLGDLSLLPQIKTFDKSQTFPMFLYAFIEKKFSYLLNGLINEFYLVEKASSIGVENIDKLYQELIDEMKDLRAMIDRYKEEYFETLSDDDNFLKAMEIFQGKARKKMFKLTFKHNLLNKCEKQLIEYFAYDVEDQSVNITKILKDLYLFIEMMKHSKIKLNELEKRRRKKASLKRRKNKHRRRKSNSDKLNKNNLNIKHMKTSTLRFKLFAIGLDDIDTPLVSKQTNLNHVNVKFSEMVNQQMSYTHKQSKQSQTKEMKENNYNYTDRKKRNFVIRPKKKKAIPMLKLQRSKTYENLDKVNNSGKKTKPKRIAPKLNIVNKLNPIRVRRKSLPNTPKTEKNKKKVGLLLSSFSKLTPIGKKSYANVDDLFGGIIDNNQSNKKMPSKKLPTTPIKLKQNV